MLTIVEYQPVGEIIPKKYIDIKMIAKMNPVAEDISPRIIAILKGNTEKFVASFDQTQIDLNRL